MSEFFRVFLLDENEVNNEANIYKINTFYTKISKNESVYYKKINKDYFKFHIKNKEKIKQNISKDLYQSEKKNLIGLELCKSSLKLDLNANFKEAFLQDYSDFSVLKIKFESENQKENFKIESLDKFKILRELQGEFDERNLARFYFSFESFDKQKCLEMISKNVNLSLNFPSYIDALSGFEAVLCSLFYKLKIIEKEEINIENLVHFSHICSQISVILSSFDNIFNKELSQKLAYKFKDLSKKCVKISKNFNAKSFDFLLSSANFNNLFSDFEMFLQESLFYKGENANLYLKKVVAIELRKKLILFQKEIFKKSLNDKESFTQLRTIFSLFASLFNEKSVSRIYEKFFDCGAKKGFEKILNKKDKFKNLVLKLSFSLKNYKD